MTVGIRQWKWELWCNARLIKISEEHFIIQGHKWYFHVCLKDWASKFPQCLIEFRNLATKLKSSLRCQLFHCHEEHAHNKQTNMTYFTHTYLWWSKLGPWIHWNPFWFKGVFATKLNILLQTWASKVVLKLKARPLPFIPQTSLEQFVPMWFVRKYRGPYRTQLITCCISHHTIWSYMVVVWALSIRNQNEPSYIVTWY